MIHYTCDRCHRTIDADVEMRYSLDVQINPVGESDREYAIDPDADHLLELHEMLEQMDEAEEVQGSSICHCGQQHFDLCRDCFNAYMRNPLARDFPVSIGFSEN